MTAIDAGRRRLLGLRSPRPAPADVSRTITVPVIDPALCNACDACVRVCAPGALRFDSVDPCYAIDPALCTDCGLCVDVCDRAAVRLERDAVAALPVRVALHRVRCPICGAEYTSTRPEPADICRSCSRPAAARGALRLQE